MELTIDVSIILVMKLEKFDILNFLSFPFLKSKNVEVLENKNSLHFENRSFMENIKIGLRI